LASCLVEVKQGVKDPSGVMFTLLLPLEERFDSLPLGVRQVRAVLHGSGSLVEVSTKQDAGGRFVFSSKSFELSNSF
jgi:hypothetical protein